MFLDVDLDPNEHPSLGLANASVAGGGDLGFEEIEQEVPPPLVLIREALHPLGKTAESPAIFSEKLREEELTEASGLLSRVVGKLDEVLVEERGARDRSETHSRGKDLGETIHPENTAVYVHGKEGRDERTRKLFEEVLIRGVSVLCPVELEEVVWVWKTVGLKLYAGLGNWSLPSSRMIKSYF